VRHLATYQGISLGKKTEHVHHAEKLSVELIVYTFWGKKSTSFFLAIKNDFVLSSKVTTDIQKRWSPLKLVLNTHQQTLDDSQPYLPQCIPL